MKNLMLDAQTQYIGGACYTLCVLYVCFRKYKSMFTYKKE